MRLQVIVLGLAGATTALWLPNNDLERGALVKRGECDDAYNNEDLYNCPRPNGHELNADGSCGKLADIQPDDTECNVYCEVRRRNFLGKKQTPNGPFGEQQAPGYALVLQEGLEVSVTEGISFGLDAALNKAFALGASLEFSVTKTTSKSIQREGEASDDYWNKWVYWPVLTTTCGSVTSATCKIFYFPEE
ncbi:hypothetical protein GQX73_g7266 [Xylaria multiplex]|uniref:Uncharacterized protein n=1 Tax=Xylaria multiplex TaxID=323545 RepID=A0A7C8IL06_9PEZI|nr:hypothetical protein GQX73_g7266 [Xylaria multiplex]